MKTPTPEELILRVKELETENLRLLRLIAVLPERWAGVPVPVEKLKRDLEYLDFTTQHIQVPHRDGD